jgi:membrane glycosyltransferase
MWDDQRRDGKNSFKRILEAERNQLAQALKLLMMMIFMILFYLAAMLIGLVFIHIGYMFSSSREIS